MTSFRTIDEPDLQAWKRTIPNPETAITRLGTLLELAKECVDEFRDKSIWIEGDVLHSTKRDLSDFWEFFRKKEAEQ